MFTPVQLLCEYKRVRELLSYEVLDSPREKQFDSLVQVAAHFFNVPVAAITFIDSNRQWIKASVGLNVCETGRKEAICNSTISQNDINEIHDLSTDTRFSHFASVTGSPFYRYYAGCPLITENGYPIGVFCLVDTKARSLSTGGKELLNTFAQNTMYRLEINVCKRRLENMHKLQDRIETLISRNINEPALIGQIIADSKIKNAESVQSMADLSAFNELLETEIEKTVNDLNKKRHLNAAQLMHTIMKKHRSVFN